MAHFYFILQTKREGLQYLLLTKQHINPTTFHVSLPFIELDKGKESLKRCLIHMLFNEQNIPLSVLQSFLFIFGGLLLELSILQKYLKYANTAVMLVGCPNAVNNVCNGNLLQGSTN